MCQSWNEVSIGLKKSNFNISSINELVDAANDGSLRWSEKNKKIDYSNSQLISPNSKLNTSNFIFEHVDIISNIAEITKLKNFKDDQHFDEIFTDDFIIKTFKSNNAI